MDETLVDISNDVIYHIKKRTSQPLNEHIHIALTDHIAFAVKRLQQGFDIKTRFSWKPKRFIRKNFKLPVKSSA